MDYYRLGWQFMAPDPKIAHVQILHGTQAGPARSKELEPVASSERHLFSTLAPTPGSRWVHLLEPRNDCRVRKQDTSNQQRLPIISKFLLAPSIATFWKNNAVTHNTLERLLTSKQTIILYDNVSIKLWWLVLNRSGEKSHMLIQNKGKSGWKREKLQFKRKRSIIKGGSTGIKNVNVLWSCQ